MESWSQPELLKILSYLSSLVCCLFHWRNSSDCQEIQVYSLSTESMETITAMLEPRTSSLLSRLSSPGEGGSGESVLPDASLEWVLLWDVYLKFLGGGDRWLAYEALADGFTAHGRRHDMWSPDDRRPGPRDAGRCGPNG